MSMYRLSTRLAALRAFTEQGIRRTKDRTGILIYVTLLEHRVVVLGDEVLGKPRDPQHAVTLLRKLSGRTHRVMTGIAVVESDTGRARSRVVESRVTLRQADEAELRDYVATGESLDKAGAYALQGAGRRFIAGVEGSETNVIGLPLEETLTMLQEAGVEIPAC